MTENRVARSGEALLHYQQAGSGEDIVFLHAGVADRRQWNDAFEHFRTRSRVLRYDQRGFGRSAPVEGSYRSIDDLQAVLAAADVRDPAVLVGCSMGGTLAMDFTIAHPQRVRALVMVCSGPSGLSLDVPKPDLFRQVELAEQAGDLERVCELETQIWFDGMARGADDVDPDARALLYEMNRLALEHDQTGLGQREFDLTPAGYKRLEEIPVPVLLVTGELDLPYTHAAADFMEARLANVQRTMMSNTAHLPNMEQPGAFNRLLERFLGDALS